MKNLLEELKNALLKDKRLLIDGVLSKNKVFGILPDSLETAMLMGRTQAIIGADIFSHFSLTFHYAKKKIYIKHLWQGFDKVDFFPLYPLFYKGFEITHYWVGMRG